MGLPERFLIAGYADMGTSIKLAQSVDGKTRDKQDFWKRLIWNPVKIWRSTEKD